MLAGIPPKITGFGEMAAGIPLPVEQSYLLLASAFLHVAHLGVPLAAALSFQV